MVALLVVCFCGLKFTFEPCHDIMTILVLRKVIL